MQLTTHTRYLQHRTYLETKRWSSGLFPIDPLLNSWAVAPAARSMRHPELNRTEPRDGRPVNNQNSPKISIPIPIFTSKPHLRKKKISETKGKKKRWREKKTSREAEREKLNPTASECRFGYSSLFVRSKICGEKNESGISLLFFFFYVHPHPSRFPELRNPHISVSGQRIGSSVSQWVCAL